VIVHIWAMNELRTDVLTAVWLYTGIVYAMPYRPMGWLSVG